VDVGIRELKDHLSRHIAWVREGHTLTVTDHGKPVVTMSPIDRPSRLEELIAAGRVTAPRAAKGPLPAPVAAGGTVSDLVAQQRR
jgi:prevent-host-death family protein